MARGVYAYPGADGKLPSPEEVAEAKIGAFVRQRQKYTLSQKSDRAELPASRPH